MEDKQDDYSKPKHAYSVTERQWARVWATAELHPDLKDTIQEDPVEGIMKFQKDFEGPDQIDFVPGWSKVYDLNLIDEYRILNDFSPEQLQHIWREEHEQLEPSVKATVFQIFENYWVVTHQPEDVYQPPVTPKLPVIPCETPPPPPNGKRLTSRAWARIFAYLFWLKATGKENGHEAEYKKLRAQCEYFLPTGVYLIIERINKEVPEKKKIHREEYLFEIWVPEDWSRIGDNELVKQIGLGNKPNYAIGMRMCC